MGRRKTKKISLSKEIVIAVAIIVLIAVIVFFALYLFVDGFKEKVHKLFDSLWSDNQPYDNEKKGENELRLHFLDVGQGDCILIELPDDTVMLIDSGDRKKETAEMITGYISSLDITRINYLMATHSDSDHIGNMVAIIEAFEIEKAYIPQIENTAITATYNNFYAALQAETYGGGEKCEIFTSMQMMMIDSVSDTESFVMAFLAPTADEYTKINGSKNPTAHMKNAVSPIMLLDYMGKRVLLTGDTVAECEEKLVDKYNNGVFNNVFEKKGGGYYGVNIENVDILKVAHHGGETSTCDNFVNLVKPKYSVISVGAGNSYNHPRDIVLQRLAEANSEIYRTDFKGTIVATIFPDEEKAIAFAFEKDGSVAAVAVYTPNCFTVAAVGERKRYSI